MRHVKAISSPSVPALGVNIPALLGLRVIGLAQLLGLQAGKKRPNFNPQFQDPEDV